jgi:hypothetical protein
MLFLSITPRISLVFNLQQSAFQMSIPKIKSLLGVWQRTDKSECGPTYPSKIMFGDNGIYKSLEQPEGAFYQWDVGTYEMKGNTRVKISCANDSIISYRIRFSKDGNEFTITIDNTCQLKYMKVN